MKVYNTYLTFIFSLLFCLNLGCTSKRFHFDNKIEKLFYDLYNPSDSPESVFHQKVFNTAKYQDSYRLQNLRSLLGGLNAIIETTNSDYFIHQQITIVDDIINSARVSKEISENISFRDNFKGWISLNRSRLYGEEIVLNEGYSFFYILQFLHYQKMVDWVGKNRRNKRWWNKNLSFVEEHIWNKWYSRSQSVRGNPYLYFLRSRTHMGAHWAGIALYLERISENAEIKRQCKEVQFQYDLLLKRNLRPNPQDNSAYIWNATYDNIEGTFAIKADTSIIQDVSHGNHVVAYIIAAHEALNKNWTETDIKMLCNTIKNIIYNKKERKFYDNVDGTFSSIRPGWGNFLADGWVKLSKYDPDVFIIFKELTKNERILNRYNQSFQMKANFLNASVNLNR